MPEEEKNQNATQAPEAQIPLAPDRESATMPATEREASNIAHEFRTLASRVESFPIQPTEKISDEAANVARMSRNLATRVEGGFKIRFNR